MRFGELGLERLIATHYTGVTDPGTPSFKIEALRGRDDTAGDGIKYVDPETGGVQTALQGDGDFRSDECVELLKQSDIVVTNPPFSLFREYVTQLVEYDKKFVILGNNNAVTYKEIWPLIQGGKFWLGTIANKTLSFGVPDDYYAPENAVVDEFGRRVVKVPAISWFTNLDHAKRHDELPLWKKYTPEEYPNYDNFVGIEVSKVADIPMDFYGPMGVPITFLGKYNPDQFEILAYSRKPHIPEDMMLDVGLDHGTPYVGGKAKYDRIFIRRK